MGQHGVGPALLRRSRPDLHAGPGTVLGRLSPAHRRRLVADAAFVDGSHVFHEVFLDLYYLRKVVKPGGW